MFYGSFSLKFTTIYRCHVKYTANGKFRYDVSLASYRSRMAYAQHISGLNYFETADVG